MGKILRIDVDNGTPYGIPKDNPFAGGGGKPEIYAYGMRNPWRMSFDQGGERQLFAADVGQTMFEEVDIIVKGGNYGWNVREGFHCFNPKDERNPPTDCPKVGADGKPFVDPIFEYKNKGGFRGDPEAMGISVTGGYVYRGKALPKLVGRYIFGDWSRNFVVPDGVVFVATPPASAGEKWTMGPLDLGSHPKGEIKACIVAFAQDSDGEVYVLTNGSAQVTGHSGKVWKLVPE